MDENKYVIYSNNMNQMFEKIKKNLHKKHKHYNDLFQICKEIQEKIKNDKNKETNADKYLIYMKMALECDNIKIIEPVLEHMQKLIQNDLLEGNNLEEIRYDNDVKVKQRKMIDSIIDAIVYLFQINDESIWLQIIKLFFVIYSNPKIKIHSGTLSKVFRVCINIFLTSRSQINQDSSKATLTQMIQFLFTRMEILNSHMLIRESGLKISNEIDDGKTSVTTSKSEFSSGIFRVFAPRNPLDDILNKILRNCVDDVCIYYSKIETIQINLANEQEIIIQSQSLTDLSKITIELNSKINYETNKIPLRTIPSNVDQILNNIKYRSVHNANIENEKGFISGNFGWCVICRQKADLYCLNTRLPICGLICKKRVNEDFEKADKYLNSEYFEEDQAILLLNDSISIFRALCKLVNTSISTSNENQNTKTKFLSLELILATIDKTGNTFLSQKEFVKLVKEDLMDGLLKTCLSEESNLFGLALSIFIKIFNLFREHLKQQIAVFIESVCLKILDSGNSSYYHKIAVLDTFQKLSGNAKFFVELYVNYDSDLNEKDLLRRIVIGIAKIAQGKYSKSDHQLTSQQDYQLRIKSLDILTLMIRSLLGFTQEHISLTSNKFLNIDDIKDGVENDEQINFNEEQSLMVDAFTIDLKERLEQSRKIKYDISVAVQKFNLKPKNGINYLKKVGIVTKEDEIKEITNFLKTSFGLNKEKIGEYLGENLEIPLKVLDCYANTYNFKNLHIIDSIRLFLSGFQLPGEGQKIDRIMQKMAEKYYKDNPQMYETADCAYYLAFAIIMLQTDTHNPHVKKKMGIEGFSKICKGINGGKDLDSNYLQDIYQQILNKPISLSEHDDAREKLENKTKTKNKEDLFKREFQKLYAEGTQQLKLGQDKQYLLICEVEHIGPLISSLWDIICAVFFLIIEDCEDLPLINYCVEGMSNSIKLCGILNLELEKEALLKGFCKMTYLLQGREIREKQILCIKAILYLAQSEGRFLKGCWKNVLDIISKLDYYHMLVSGSKMEIESFVNEIRNKKKGINTDREILIEKQNIEKINKEISSDDYEIIFSKSTQLDQDSIIDFVKSLSEVSNEEISNKDNYRIFSLQKLVEVSDYNMGRIRIVWAKIWLIISDYFTIVGSNSNSNIAEKAIDSLRQLATKFLQKDEISVYQFQKDFLKPFENILINNINVYRTKEYVITCIANLVLLQASSIKSGWRIIFNIFQLAAEDSNKEIIQKTFDTISTVFKNHFSQVKDNFPELAHCLKKFSKNYPKQCIELFFSSYRSLEESNHIFALLSSLSSMITDIREDVRTYACQVFFKLIQLASPTFTPEFWQQIFKAIINQIVDDLVTTQMDTTLHEMLCEIVEIFSVQFDKVDFLLPNFLELITNIISCGIEIIAQCGISGLKMIIFKLENQNTTEKFWESIAVTISNIFKKTRQTELLNLDLSNINILKQNQNVFYNYQNIVNKNIVFCIIQHNLIGLCEEIVENYFNRIRISDIYFILDCLNDSFELAYDFNCRFNLRKSISIHFMKDLKQAAALFKQQKDGCSLYFKILNKIQDSEEFNLIIKETNKKKIVDYSIKILSQFLDRVNYYQDDDYLLSENERLLNCMVSVLCENIIPTLIKIDFQNLDEYRDEFMRIFLDMILCNNIDVRLKVKDILAIVYDKINKKNNN